MCVDIGRSFSRTSSSSEEVDRVNTNVSWFLVMKNCVRRLVWTGEKFMLQLEKAFKIAEFKYNPDEFTVVWLFDQSSCHKAFASDALNVNNMNVKSGGKQAVMHDTVWAGKPQKLVDSAGVPKGMKRILEERGINTQTLKGDDMRVILANHDDFRDEKTVVENFFLSKCHKVHFIPKFHCEINSIE